MILLIDNYDSFTYNLSHSLAELGAAIRVVRNDRISVDGALALQPSAIVLSPGPCAPDQAGICLELVAASASLRIPLLGVCLGHQTIGQYFGGAVVRAPSPMHGKTSLIHHQQDGLFADLPTPFSATRYHSLLVERTSLPDALQVTAWSDDGLIMGLAHRSLPIFGVQFHPESIASEFGRELLANFLALSAAAPGPDGRKRAA